MAESFKHLRDVVPNNNVEIVIADDGWNSIEHIEKYVQTVATATLKHCHHEKQGIALLLTNDDAMRDLNSRFRGKDSPTNVLSFPSAEDQELGDIAIGWQIINKEAEEQAKKVVDHFTHLLVHGILHLIGYDHEEDEQAQKMEATEKEILLYLKIANPYE